MVILRQVYLQKLSSKKQHFVLILPFKVDLFAFIFPLILIIYVCKFAIYQKQVVRAKMENKNTYINQ